MEREMREEKGVGAGQGRGGRGKGRKWRDRQVTVELGSLATPMSTA